MPAMRNYTEDEIPLVQKSFSGRYALRDRCYFEMALQMGLRVSEMLSIRVGQVYQYGKIVDEVSIERKHMKGGKAGKASGRTVPLFGATKPYVLAWLQRLATMLQAKDVKDLDPHLPLFMSRVRGKDGGRRAISREQAWRIIKGIARENELPGHIGTHSTRKTLAQRAERQFQGNYRKVQRILGHKSLSSTEHYLRSLTEREVWDEYRASTAA